MEEVLLTTGEAALILGFDMSTERDQKRWKSLITNACNNYGYKRSCIGVTKGIRYTYEDIKKLWEVMKWRYPSRKRMDTLEEVRERLMGEQDHG